MVIVLFDSSFEKVIKKIKDKLVKDKIKKQIRKIIESPKIGKPMRYTRKGTREVYVSPYRLSYIYIEKENKVVFLDLYHKDQQ
jgi:mRNA-degrading endonuclease RelE of RelBE toxin-antitoxin system